MEVCVHDLRQYATDKHRTTDDYAFGGGAGMVMLIEPIDRCIQALKAERAYDEVIYMSPDGELFNQALANQLSLKQNLVLLCGHYKGVDERVREHLITKEISIGDYVLSGGELAAAVVADAVIRIPFKTICWHHPCTPAPRPTKVGKCRRCCCLAIRQKLRIGATKKPLNEPASAGPDC